MRNWILRVCVVLMGLSPLVARADDYGPFFCDTCPELGEVVAIGETRAFISGTVNMSRPAEDGGWDVHDTVVICNGSICVTYEYLANGQFSFVKSEEDNHSPSQYVYGPSGGSGGGGDSGGGNSGGGGSSGGGYYVEHTQCGWAEGSYQCHSWFEFVPT